MRGFVRVGAAVPVVAPGAVERNAAETLALWRQADEEGCAVAVFPELGLTGYSIRDLLADGHLLEAARRALLQLADDGRRLRALAIVGLPLRVGGALYNVAAAIQGGRVLALVPKSYLPTYREFEEARWFQPGVGVRAGSSVRLLEDEVPFGADVLLACKEVADLVVGIEVCEDLWVQQPPHVAQVSAGATLVCNLSASNFTVGKAELRRLLCKSASDRGKCAYVYVAAGPGESSTDLAFDSDAFVCENGRELATSKRFARKAQLVTADLDLELLAHERISTTTFGDCARHEGRPFRRVTFSGREAPGKELRREVAAHPFLPRDPASLATRCWEIFEIQSNALVTRLEATRTKKLVLGVSGGLDSTHAALVCAQALDLMGLPRNNLIGVTMPGLGTTKGTRGNAERLAATLGCEFREVGVAESSRLLLSQVGHPAAEGCATVDELVARVRATPGLGDITLENVQARLRTLVLMTFSNKDGALVCGTGDLSEKALGWSTYTGDHISHYDVNCGVPKTLIQFVVRWVANERAATWQGDAQALRETLFAILKTPISPELLPSDASGQIAQLTEGTLGPYELHDFFLYHLVRHGARPGRILDLASVAFAGGRYDATALKRWLTVFLTRFFRNQFKRSCTADGPKVGMVALSPRGDWRMPSDAQVDSWLAEVERWS